MSDDEPIRPLGQNHALICGMVGGALARISEEHFKVSPEIDGKDFTGRVLIRRPSGVWAVQVVPVAVLDF